MKHWDVVPDVVTLGKGFGNGFPVTCAVALASIEVIEEENILEHAMELGDYFENRMSDRTTKYAIVGDCRVKGCLLGVELVKDKTTK